MSKSGIAHRHYDASFKIQLVEEALRGDVSKADICRKYSLKNANLLYQWIRTFAPKPELIADAMNVSKCDESAEIRELRSQLRLKELELKKEKMRADFLDEMINVSEEMFNIPIRKKAGTKQ